MSCARTGAADRARRLEAVRRARRSARGRETDERATDGDTPAMVSAPRAGRPPSLQKHDNKSQHYSHPFGRASIAGPRPPPDILRLGHRRCPDAARPVMQNGHGFWTNSKIRRIDRSRPIVMTGRPQDDRAVFSELCPWQHPGVCHFAPPPRFPVQSKNCLPYPCKHRKTSGELFRALVWVLPPDTRGLLEGPCGPMGLIQAFTILFIVPCILRRS